MPTTTPKGYPYPLGTDRVMDGDDVIHSLASKVDVAAGTAATGRISFTISAVNTPVAVAITYPAGRFVNTPSVLATPLGVSPQWISVGMGTAGGTNTGVTLYGARSSGTQNFDAYWIARDVA